MEVKIKLNDMKYRYDVYQMFNIYFPLDEIKFLDDGDYIVNILEDKVEFKCNEYYNETKIFENIKEDIKRLVFSSLKDITKEEYPWGILVGIRPSKIKTVIVLQFILVWHFVLQDVFIVLLQQIL